MNWPPDLSDERGQATVEVAVALPVLLLLLLGALYLGEVGLRHADGAVAVRSLAWRELRCPPTAEASPLEEYTEVHPWWDEGLGWAGEEPEIDLEGPFELFDSQLTQAADLTTEIPMDHGRLKLEIGYESRFFEHPYTVQRAIYLDRWSADATQLARDSEMYEKLVDHVGIVLVYESWTALVGDEAGAPASPP